MATLQKTSGNAPTPRVDFDKQAFDDIITQKGRNVVVTRALKCPCKSPVTNQLSNCRNCGGVGYVFINPEQTRMVVQKIDLVNDFTPWSEENRGHVSLSYNSCEDLTWMDKITIVDSEAIFNEVLFFKETQNSVVFAYTVYPIKKVKYLGLYIDNNTKLKKLVLNVDYTFENNIITLINQSLIQGGDVVNTSITIRYVHAPVFYIVEMKRESMDTFVLTEGSEKKVKLPLNAVARRAHYVLNTENINGTRLLDNNYTESMCNIFVPNQMKYLPIHYVFTDTAATYTNIQLIGKLIMLFRNGVLDTQYTLDLLTGTITPTYSYQANEYIDIYIWGAAS